jgi:glycosyltransferase involved in cell wall biosynthesis
MHIGFILIPYQEATGAGEHCRNLIRNLSARNQQHQFTVFLPRDIKCAVFDDLANVRCINTPIKQFPGSLRYLGLARARFVQNHLPKIDLAHYFNFPLPLIKSGRTVLTIHDLREEDLPGTYPFWHSVLMRFFSAPGLRKADRIITVSEFSRSRLLHHYPFTKDKVNVIYNAVDGDEIDYRALPERSPRSRPYIFTLGQLSPHKNLPNLVRGFNLLCRERRDLDLVIGGKNFAHVGYVNELQKLAEDPERVVFTGRLSERDKIWYLKNAEVFVYPSLYEGFGIPLLEAFVLRTPVAASKIPVFEEIYGIPEAMFDASDPIEIAETISRICAQRELRARLILAGQKRLSDFDWKEIADKTMNVYEQLSSTTYP